MSEYIYIMQCPVDESIKYIGIGKNVQIERSVILSNQYEKWLNKLKKVKLKPKYLIIDKCSAREAPFLLEYYRGLFLSWGFDLFESFLYDKRNPRKIYFATDLERNILLKSTPLSNFNDINDKKIILWHLSDLLHLTGVNRLVDEWALFNILIFIYGKKIWDFEEIIFINLQKSHYSFIYKHGKETNSPCAAYVLEFISRYNINQNPTEKVFKKLNLNIRYLDQILSKSMKYFRYPNIFEFGGSDNLPADRYLVRYLLKYKVNVPTYSKDELSYLRN